jgi:hypothetical protein
LKERLGELSMKMMVTGMGRSEWVVVAIVCDL